ncbi:MAG TPA: tetratricopeptide repeat protein [Kutzneria sp.]|jgi:tetratricopeptide (TPR) repeat protein|nr:tetratricopeptide repeat protein [Kutzneria sp.]
MDAETIAELLETAEKARARAAEDAVHRADLASALLALGIAYNDHGEFPDAIATVEEAVDIWRSVDGDQRGSLAVGLATLSGYYLAIGLDEEANAAAAEAANLG